MDHLWRATMGRVRNYRAQMGRGKNKIKNRTGYNVAGQELSRVKIKSIFGGQQQHKTKTNK